MPEPLAYLLTWTCRGTWLHGDERGSFFRVTGKKLPTPLDPSPRLNATSKRKLTAQPVRLGPDARRHVDNAIHRVCETRGWQLLAVAVRSNHVHVIVTPPGYQPEQVMRQLKSWSTRDLRDQGAFDESVPIWTRHGSTRYLWNEDSLAAAIEYVRDWQDRRRD